MNEKLNIDGGSQRVDLNIPNLKQLSKLDESYEALNGLSFDELSEGRQKALESYGLTYMVIPLNTPKPDVFEV